MRLFAEVKVSGESVFKKMDDEVSGEQKERRFGTCEFNAFRQHLQERSADHEARAQRNKIAQIAAFPVFPDDDSTTQAVGQGGSYSEQYACGDWAHGWN